VSDSANKPSRRDLLKIVGAGAATAAAASAIPSCGTPGFEDYFQQHYKKMTPEEVQATVARFEKRYSEKYDVDAKVSTKGPIPGVVYGYAINISKCKGYRECVKACVQENNQGRDPEIQYIRVLELDQGTMNLETADHYYDPATVPQPGKFYLPVQCMQCDNPPCVKACPVEATWREDDGIVVIDYDWCIGCRYCATACPYWARKFNWTEPNIPANELNPVMHYLSNRPRQKGVMEKCTFCLQRTREGRQPACQEACPTGARVFGNLLDPNSEIRYVLEHKTVFRLKEELNTEPKVWYFTG
jgi:Fe-S-cluster-containing dehydrogenase component